MNSDFRTVRLEKFCVGLSQRLDRYLCETEATFLEHAAGDIIAQVRGFVWGERVDALSISHPSDWWQAFKDRWFPRWLLKKYPVKFTKHCFDVRALYPNFKPSVPTEKYNLMVVEV